MSDSIVIFGASGDLTSRKLIPALFRLFHKKRLPEGSRIVGVSRSVFDHQSWRDSLRDTASSNSLTFGGGGGGGVPSNVDRIQFPRTTGLVRPGKDVMDSTLA